MFTDYSKSLGIYFYKLFFTADIQVSFANVALRNTCNTPQQSDKILNINILTADKILSVTKSCQRFFEASAPFSNANIPANLK